MATAGANYTVEVNWRGHMFTIDQSTICTLKCFDSFIVGLCVSIWGGTVSLQMFTRVIVVVVPSVSMQS